MRVLGLIDSYRQRSTVGGFTWTRGNKYSRLDYVIVSDNLAPTIGDVRVDWAFDKSDHAAVKVKIALPMSPPVGLVWLG